MIRNILSSMRRSTCVTAGCFLFVGARRLSVSVNWTCLLVFLLVVSGLNPLSAQAVQVKIEIHDYAGLSRNSLREFALSMQRILTSGNLLAHIAISPAASKSQCARRHRTIGSLQIRILRDAPNKTKAQPILGEAFVGDTRGRYASVFLQAVQQQASAAGVPWTVVLAYAGSHEVGHLLLGGAHTPRGVMKAHWNRIDYESMNQKDFRFSTEQVRQFALINATDSADHRRVSALTGFTAVSSSR